MKLILWITGAALLLAALVPDFSHGIASVLMIQVVTPLAIAGPAAHAALREHVDIVAGFGLAFLGVLLHDLVSGTIYRYTAGYAAFHDGISIPVLIGSFVLKLLVIIVIFLLVWAIHHLAKKRSHASSGL